MPDKDFKQEALRLAQKIVLHSKMTVPWAEEEIAQALCEAFKRGQIAAWEDAARMHNNEDPCLEHECGQIRNQCLRTKFLKIASALKAREEA